MRFTTKHERPVIYQDHLLFEPLGENAYRAFIQTSYGKIEVWCCMPETTDYKRPYEVWYPGAKESTHFQTASDIMNYILNR